MRLPKQFTVSVSVGAFIAAAVIAAASAGAQPMPTPAPPPAPGDPGSTNEQLTDMVLAVIEDGTIAPPPSPVSGR